MSCAGIIPKEAMILALEAHGIRMLETDGETLVVSLVRRKLVVGSIGLVLPQDNLFSKHDLSF